MRLLISVLLFFFLSLSATAQLIYQLKYSLLKANDATGYTALFAFQSDDEGIMRIRYTSPVNGDTVLLEMNARMQYPAEVNTDAGKVYFELTDPKLKRGDVQLKYNKLLLAFSLDPSGQVLEPFGISTGSKAATDLDTFSEKNSIEFNYLRSNKDFVSLYFNNGDALYKNLFGSASRDFTARERTKKFFLIIVADTKDSSIGLSSTVDMKKIEQSFKNIARFMKLKEFIPTIISGDEFSKYKVEDAINGLSNVTDQDIIVFYYSGHGFRLDNESSSRFPRIKLWPYTMNENMRFNRNNEANYEFIDRNSLNMDRITKLIKDKKARFNLIISDCCNTRLKTTKPEAGPLKTQGGMKDFETFWSEENCRKLFLDTRPATIRLTSAAEGEEAPGNQDYGGIFTYNFKLTLDTYLTSYKSNVSWEEIIRVTKRKATAQAENTLDRRTNKSCKIHPVSQ